MGFSRFVAIVAGVGVLALVSKLILGLESVPGGLRLIMVLGLAAVVGLAIADSGPRRRSHVQPAGARFVVAARPTGQPDATGVAKPWRDGRMPRDTRPARPTAGRARRFKSLSPAAHPLAGQPHRAARPRDGGEPRRDERHRPFPNGSRRERASSWRRLDR